jgi:hypothetical protein
MRVAAMQLNVLRAHEERLARRNKERQAALRSPLTYVALFASILSICFGTLPLLLGTGNRGHYAAISVSLTVCAIAAAAAFNENRSLNRRIEALEKQLNESMRDK